MEKKLEFLRAKLADFLARQGLDKTYFAEVTSCTNLQQVFTALDDPRAEHFAVLSQAGEPVEQSLDLIKSMFSTQNFVPLAKLYRREH